MEKKTTSRTFNKKRIFVFVVFLTACLCLAAYIFNLSTMTSQESAKKSVGIVDNVTKIVAAQSGVKAEDLPEETVDVINLAVRKSGHFMLFALLGVLTYFLSASLWLKEKNYWICTCFSIPVCVLYAITDEIHQTFVKGRHGKVTDVIVDAVGAVIGTLLAVAVTVLYGRIRKKCLEKNKNE